MAIGKRLFDQEMKRAEQLWELRYKEPERARQAWSTLAAEAVPTTDRNLKAAA